MIAIKDNKSSLLNKFQNDVHALTLHSYQCRHMKHETIVFEVELKESMKFAQTTTNIEKGRVYSLVGPCVESYLVYLFYNLLCLILEMS